jgi:hypothetical protein
LQNANAFVQLGVRVFARGALSGFDPVFENQWIGTRLFKKNRNKKKLQIYECNVNKRAVGFSKDCTGLVKDRQRHLLTGRLKALRLKLIRQRESRSEKFD